MVLQTSGESVNAPESAPDAAGLTASQAAQRLLEDGPNALPGDQRHTLGAIIKETLHEPMFMLLLAAGSLYLVLGDLQEGLVLFGLVLVVLALTLYQEGKTERALESLRDLTSPRALVLREGRYERIAGRDVVRGDLLVLFEGDRIAADAVLISGHDVQVDESLLTGEAVPVSKEASATPVLPASCESLPRTKPRRPSHWPELLYISPPEPRTSPPRALEVPAVTLDSCRSSVSSITTAALPVSSA
ncbi:MAG: cation-transporting P-type ATPase, partial [Pseudomonadota bacterium]